MAAEGQFPPKIIAAMLKITERRLQQLAAEGILPKSQQGLYPLVGCIHGYIDFLKRSGHESSRGAEHAALARAQTVKVEIENLRRMGELQTTAQCEETMQGLVVTMRSAHEGLPGRLSSEFAGITEPGVIYRRLQSELRSILNLCADYLEKRAVALEAMPEPGEGHAPVGADPADDLG